MDKNKIMKALTNGGHPELNKWIMTGRDNYPNIIDAVIDDGQLIVTYLQLNGWIKNVYYELGEDHNEEEK